MPLIGTVALVIVVLTPTYGSDLEAANSRCDLTVTQNQTSSAPDPQPLIAKIRNESNVSSARIRVKYGKAGNVEKIFLYGTMNSDQRQRLLTASRHFCPVTVDFIVVDG